MCESCYCEVQADVILGETSGGLTSTTHETVTFNDAVLGQKAGLDISAPAETRTDQTENIDFVKFLSRPVRIANFTWLETDGVGTSHTYNPWDLYFSDARVKYKLNNFAFLQCKLKVKVLINASPFYYGRMYMGYQPLPTLTPSTIQPDAGTRYLIPYSQRPHIWIEPMDNAGGEMTLPFFYQQNWINAQSSQSMRDQGQLTFLNYTTLQSANGAAGAGVTIAIYAWAEDVSLSGPSVGLATQSLELQSDEYGSGAISGPASAVANAASWLEDVPFIGRFATATRMGASAVSSIASLFGWTNVPVIADAMPFRVEPFPQLASTQLGYPVHKLTLDPKNELSVDPSVTGLLSEDELAIKCLVTKPSFLCSTQWASFNNTDDILFTANVNPTLYDNDGATNSKLYMTPVCWVSQLFNNWRGDLVFKFKVVASQFHKGRLRISFDPSGYAGENLTTDATSANVVFTSILDLGDSNEVEFVVPYQQATSFLARRDADLTVGNTNWSTSGAPPFKYSPLYDNGTLTVRVLTGLTAPLATSSVFILVYVRAADNFELANPTEVRQYSTFAVQSDSIADVREETLGTMQHKHCAEGNLINFGETVKSLRQLLRRYTMTYTTTGFVDTTSPLVVWRRQFTKIPPQYGYDPAGINLAKGLVLPLVNFPFNWTTVTPLNWLLPAFVAYRGSTHWTFNTESGAIPVQHVRVFRQPNPSGNPGESQGGYGLSNPSVNAANYKAGTFGGSSGQTLTNTRSIAGLSVATPMYTQYRFQSTNPVNSTAPISADGSVRDQYILEMRLSGTGLAPLPASTVITTYNSIGTDFGCHFFLNVPTFWIYSGVPVPF